MQSYNALFFVNIMNFAAYFVWVALCFVVFSFVVCMCQITLMCNIYVGCLITSTLMTVTEMYFHGVLNGTFVVAFVVHFDCLIYVAFIVRFEYDCILILLEKLLPVCICNGIIIKSVLLLLLLQLNTNP